MLLISLAAVALTIASAPPPTPTPQKRQDVDAIIRSAVAAWSKVHTLRATFEQTVVNPITGSSLVSKGELQQRKPSRLAITFSDPAGDRIVADGKDVWVFLPSATPGQVIKMTNAAAGASNTDLIGQFLSTPRRKYTAADAGADSVGGRRARVLVLTAKAGEALPFLRAKVWVDAKDSLIRQFESTDANGITRHVRLLTLTPNAAVRSSAFTFSVPEGVRVVEP